MYRLTGLIDALITEEQELLTLKNLQINRFDLFLQQYRAVSKLHDTGHLSELDWLEYRSRYFEEKQKIKASGRQITQTRNRLTEGRFQLGKFPDIQKNTLSELFAR